MVAGVSASQAAKGKHPHRNNKKFAVLATVIIGAILAGIAVYVYISTTNNTEESNNVSSQPSKTSDDKAQTPTAPATTDDVDAVNQEVDEAIQALDEATDFPEEDLSDESLGL
jgi:CBS-domain-containing membrane protein